jgi:DNA (cytosine-5)-methyltransferase 1
MPIPVIDLFAGPGGLNEGFSRVRDACGNRVFQTVLSVECEAFAHRTLELRALFRRLQDSGETEDYRKYLAGEIKREDLFANHKAAAGEAQQEALMAKLGKSDTLNLEIEEKIAAALKRCPADECVLIGGPPCQAYSLVGRARRTHDDEFEDDEKHLLYQEYLHIVRKFNPAVFLMENVPGLLSAKHRGTKVFERICNDLRGAGYSVHPMNPAADGQQRGDNSDNPRDYVIQAHEHEVPQARSRVFILGLRSDLRLKPSTLPKHVGSVVTVADVLSDLPRIRSRLSREEDSDERWLSAIQQPFGKYDFPYLNARFRKSLWERLDAMRTIYPLGARAMEPTRDGPCRLSDWLTDSDIKLVINHNSRAHIRRDLHRYFFWSQYAAFYKESPSLADVPHYLRPAHENVKGNAIDIPFKDRFRVQLRSAPSTTIVAHIAKDGHYYIHYEPKQCRSLSVREAARLQTFPDSYFFEGTITEQYTQVGNAVPPYLAYQLAKVVRSIIAGTSTGQSEKTDAA